MERQTHFGLFSNARGEESDASVEIDRPERTGSSDFRTFQEIASNEESLFNWQTLSEKGYRKLYSEVMGRADVLSMCKLQNMSHSIICREGVHRQSNREVEVD